ncbi:MAG TPA: universal stress protein [Candidatus Limnocylindrales bacterium]|nr:universal stress protein [Candidatus Limnocylindrales bacterium]
MSRIRRILHPSDFSPASGNAFSRAVEMAKANRAELIIVHGWSPVMPIAGHGYIPPKAYDEMVAAVRADGNKHLVALVAKAKKAGARARGLLLEGVPFEVITRAAKAQRADLVVIGTHGRTGLAKFFMGSVAQRVVGMSPCPVMTVRGRTGA